MKRVELSAASWENPRAAHEALAAALGFPGYYGHNLDALYDCLTDLPETQLVIEDCARASEAMPEKWPGFLTVFLDAAKANSALDIILLPGNGDRGE